MSASRLEDLTDTLAPALGQALWSWDPCTTCRPSAPCASKLCPNKRIGQLSRYHQYYTAVVSAYVDSAPSPSRLLETHEELFKAVVALKSNPDATRDEFCQLAFPQDVDEPPHDPICLSHAVSLIVKVLLMIEPSPLHHLSDRLEKGTFRVGWRSRVPFSQYIRDLFPPRDHLILSHPDHEVFFDVRSKLRATNLKELGVSLRPTHDIQNHLCFDREENALEIFHHTAFLKEQLRVTKGEGNFSDPSVSIAAGALPRQLVLEVLDSIQNLLFPLADSQSKSLLRSLTKSCSFDPDILTFEFRSVRNLDEDNLPYVFLAGRLSDLYNEMQNPQPRGWIGRFVERRSGARYMMIATLVGVLFAVFLGMLSLAVSSYQTWIAYQAWQHPVSPAS